ncbi:protein of unknown function [Pseudodesulfovibrio piezophilus C1TLV30]|uniref:Uncharacterized protein n=1 Tax=Pseudodesulfovibrio piezophilus (strain DSM 21447 / JCM 15486 / C1TLV30) TaxID=1322246 RepID=M1WK12_PSEP2|nr:protein of unknown function [Pseudodesulfovibrio piezophilus C1TLV30]
MTGVEGAARGCAPSTISVIKPDPLLSGHEKCLAEGLEKTLKGTGMVGEGENGESAFDPLVGFVVQTAGHRLEKLGACHWLPPCCFGAVRSSSATNSEVQPSVLPIQTNFV